MDFVILKNKNVWIIGGAGYLGKSIVKMLLESGAKVLCADLNNKAEDFGISINADENFIPVSVDVRDEKATESFVRENIQKSGVPDGLVNLTFGASGKSLEEVSGADFDNANHLGLTATFLISRTIATEMAKNGNGSIVLFSSMYGMVSPYPEVYKSPMNMNPIEYGTGKAGIIQMTKYFAVYYAKKGVRFNCISPGPFPNPSVQKEYPDFVERLEQKVPMGRIGRPKEIAGAVTFLLSDLASFITGHNLVIDGGWTCW
jgi:NAD(P)-dependent dehydrogenase (short-subunit alcohol dehydrogenase family)